MIANNSLLKISSLILLCFLFSGCGTLKAEKVVSPAPPSASKIIRQDGKLLTDEQLLEQMKASQVIYLGETHDNADHHQLQLKALLALVKSGVRPAIGFEFFSREQTGWLMNFSLGNPSSLKEEPDGRVIQVLRGRLGWIHRSSWRYYAPLLQLARDYQLPVFGADLAQGTRVRLGRQGVDEIYEVERARLPESTLESPAYKALMIDLMARAHCHHASEGLLERLYSTFLIRNETMANAILEMRMDLDPEQPVVMILGRGHTEFDMAVVERVAFRAPTLKQLNIGLVEGVSDNQLDYVPRLGPKVNQVRFDPAHPVYWVTPGRSSRGKSDPCAVFTKGKHSKQTKKKTE